MRNAISGTLSVLGSRVFEGLHSRVEKMSGEAPNWGGVDLVMLYGAKVGDSFLSLCRC